MKRLQRIWQTIRIFKNFPAIYFSKFRTILPVLRTRDGAHFRIGNLNSNLISLIEVYGERQYGLPPKGTVIDIGANIGAFSVYAAKGGATVYAYEPEPGNYRLLSLNASGLPIHTFMRAVGGETGMRRLYVQGPYSGKNSFHPSFKPVENIEVPCETLEGIVDSIGICDFLKIDCEGAEYEILKNAPKHTFDRIKSICLEFHGVQGESPEGISVFLSKMGFVVEKSKTAESILWARK